MKQNLGVSAPFQKSFKYFKIEHPVFEKKFLAHLHVVVLVYFQKCMLMKQTLGAEFSSQNILDKTDCAANYLIFTHKKY